MEKWEEEMIEALDDLSMEVDTSGHQIIGLMVNVLRRQPDGSVAVKTIEIMKPTTEN